MYHVATGPMVGKHTECGTYADPREAIDAALALGAEIVDPLLTRLRRDGGPYRFDTEENAGVSIWKSAT